MKWPTWNLHDLFICVGFISVGMAVASVAVAAREKTLLDLLALLAALLCFGAGVGILFQRPLRGAILGLLLPIMLFPVASCVIFLVVSIWRGQIFP